MAEQTPAACGGGDSIKTMQFLAVILIFILAVFMVKSLNDIKASLNKLNNEVDVLVTITAQNTLSGFQAVDTNDKVVYKFVPVPMVDGPGLEPPPEP
ncbi:MAG: hypothetical protein GX595_13055 [Lentisphaerae bacterium]|nr:hypothetical protein [Lentisphaerota bacterium]